jgi:hypothetical protein
MSNVICSDLTRKKPPRLKNPGGLPVLRIRKITLLSNDTFPLPLNAFFQSVVEQAELGFG